MDNFRKPNMKKPYRKPWNKDRITYIGSAHVREKTINFGIKAEDRSRHMYIIGKTGTGKSSLLECMAVQDFSNDEGVIFMDPHGSSAEKLIDCIPKHRLDDVIYFAPFDVDHPIAFNIMEDIGYDKRHLVASSLLSAFKKIWGEETWSARMEHILNNTLLALLESPDTTLLDVNRMYAYKNFRERVVNSLKDPQVKSFWLDEFARYTDRFAQDATPAIQNKIGQFTSNPVIRNIIAQPKSSFDLREVMDQGKIMIINLSKGQIGDGNAAMLGVLFSTKIYLTALSRADLTRDEMEAIRPVNFYVDEFQSFASDTFADILSEARKYKLNLILAHQYIAQMTDNVREAVFGNVGTMVSFRVGPLDAELFEKLFTPRVMMDDLIGLERGQIYLSLMIDGVGSPPFSAQSFYKIPVQDESYRDEVIAQSRKRHGTDRTIVEQNISGRIEMLREGEKKGANSNNNQRSPQGRQPSFNNRQDNNFNRRPSFSNQSSGQSNRQSSFTHRQDSNSNRQSSFNNNRADNNYNKQPSFNNKPDDNFNKQPLHNNQSDSQPNRQPSFNHRQDSNSNRPPSPNNRQDNNFNRQSHNNQSSGQPNRQPSFNNPSDGQPNKQSSMRDLIHRAKKEEVNKGIDKANILTEVTEEGDNNPESQEWKSLKNIKNLLE